MTAATPSDWKNTPMPELCVRLRVDRAFSAEESARLREGLVPRRMEDKWFIVWEGGSLRFHRSWTGLCVYEVRFEAGDGPARAVEVVVNRDPEQYGGTDDDHDLRLLGYLIDRLLLGREVAFPFEDDADPRNVLRQWHVVGRLD